MALNVRRSSRSTPPTVHIFLQRVVRQANGMLSITPVCSSLAEIESEIKAMQHELDAILELARQTYAKDSAAGAAALRAGA